MMSKPMPARKKETRPDTEGFAFLRPHFCFSVSAPVRFLLSTAVSARCGAFTGVLPPRSCCCCCRCRGYVTRSITAEQPESEMGGDGRDNISDGATDWKMCLWDCDEGVQQIF